MISRMEAPPKERGVKATDVRYSMRPVAAEIRDGMLWVTLEGGRIIGTPLEWYPRLANATPEQQANVKLSTVGLHWEELDEDLSVRGMIRGCDGYLDSLDAVMTVQEIADEFGIHRQTVHDAMRHDWLPSRKSGGTHLIRRRDAEERWGRDGKR